MLHDASMLLKRRSGRTITRHKFYSLTRESAAVALALRSDYMISVNGCATLSRGTSYVDRVDCYLSMNTKGWSIKDQKIKGYHYLWLSSVTGLMQRLVNVVCWKYSGSKTVCTADDCAV